MGYERIDVKNCKQNYMDNVIFICNKMYDIFSDLKSQCSVYMIFSYASEAIAVAGLLFLLYEKYLWKKDKFLGVPILEEKYKGRFFLHMIIRKETLNFLLSNHCFQLLSL